MRTALRFGCWLAGLAAVLVALLGAGRRLPSPPLTDPSSIWAWIERTDPAVAAFTILRLLAIVVVGYLLVTTALVALAHAVRVPALIRASSPLALPAIRRLAHGATGAGLAITVVGSSTVLAGAAPAPPGPSWRSTAAVSLVAVADDLPRRDDDTDPPDAATDAPVLHGLPDDPVLVDLGASPASPTSTTADTAPPPSRADEPRATEPTTLPQPTDQSTSPPPPALPAPAPTAPPVLRAEPVTQESDPPSDPPAADRASPVATCTIVAGDHLWGVAERTLAAAWGRPPRAASTADYLQRLIEQNRSVLVVAGDPDLILPGQVFTLPPTPPSPGG